MAPNSQVAPKTWRNGTVAWVYKDLLGPAESYKLRYNPLTWTVFVYSVSFREADFCDGVTLNGVHSASLIPIRAASSVGRATPF